MNLLVKLFVISLITLLGFNVEAQNNYTVTVKVVEANTNTGKMFIALYNSETGFLNKRYKGTISKIENKTCTVTFKNIPKGTYAVSIYHDENDNGKLDTNFFGVPSEDYGCSNDATGFMGPPEWDDAKFNLSENKTIKITL